MLPPLQEPENTPPGRGQLLLRLAHNPVPGVGHEHKGRPDATSSAAHKTNAYEERAMKQLAIQRGMITRPATFTQHVIITGPWSTLFIYYHL